MTVKRIIETYEEFLAALQAKQSDDRVERNEAKNALGNLRIKYPERFEKFTKRYEGIEDPQPVTPAKPRKPRAKAGDKEQYIREHPEINVEELRNKARERLMKGKYGMGLRHDVPSWLTEENLLNSIDRLTIPDLLTTRGKPIPHQTLLRKCIKIAVIENRIDVLLLQNTILDATFSYFKPVLNQTPRETRGFAKKAFCSACREVISAKGVQSFISADGTINVNKMLRSIPEKGNEKLFELLFVRKP